MTESSGISIANHADQWVALVNNKIVAASGSFPELVRKLQSQNLLKKATVTHVSGTHAIF